MEHTQGAYEPPLDPPRSAFGANEIEFANEVTQVVRDWVVSVSERSNLVHGRHADDPG